MIPGEDPKHDLGVLARLWGSSGDALGSSGDPGRLWGGSGRLEEALGGSGRLGPVKSYKNI